jgi:hypothetical protein
LQSFQTTTRRAVILASLAAGIAVPLVIVTAIAGFPTGVYWLSGRLHPVERTVSLSPHGTHRVTVTTRIHVPVNEIRDPSILVDSRMTDVRTGKVVDSIQFFLWEETHFGKATVVWRAEEVATVADLDNSHGLALTLDARRWSSGGSRGR